MKESTIPKVIVEEESSADQRCSCKKFKPNSSSIDSETFSISKSEKETNSPVSIQIPETEVDISTISKKDDNIVNEEINNQNDKAENDEAKENILDIEKPMNSDENQAELATSDKDEILEENANKIEAIEDPEEDKSRNNEETEKTLNFTNATTLDKKDSCNTDLKELNDSDKSNSKDNGDGSLDNEGAPTSTVEKSKDEDTLSNTAESNIEKSTMSEKIAAKAPEPSFLKKPDTVIPFSIPKFNLDHLKKSDNIFKKTENSKPKTVVRSQFLDYNLMDEVVPEKPVAPKSEYKGNLSYLEGDEWIDMGAGEIKVDAGRFIFIRDYLKMVVVNVEISKTNFTIEDNCILFTAKGKKSNGISYDLIDRDYKIGFNTKKYFEQVEKLLGL